MKFCNHPTCSGPCRRSKPEKKKYVINKVSKKQKALNEVYNREAVAYKKANPHCKAQLQGCQYFTRDIHHSAGRGKNLLNKDTWLPVCRSCHVYLENHPEFAKENSLSVSRLLLTGDTINGQSIILTSKA